MQLPLKTRILQYAIQKNVTFNKKDVMKDLQKEYPGESIFNNKQVEAYLDELLVVGFLKKQNVAFDNDGSLLITYLISEYGMSRAKYISGKG